MASNPLEIGGAVKRTEIGSTDWYYGGGAEAYSGKTSAYASIPSSVRPGKMFGVYETGVINTYQWNTSTNLADGDEVLFTSSSSGGTTQLNNTVQY